ncbi:uncharacterized protein LOC123682508 [Harmonia axyridis]|uniref:uncharacterized protein LOC123682508 n=1 Tax=Harmonia axyridis TaxID=115357 RepID=UPI001E277218|nr:uncharacterized protein LOC123682508 [Harmonia axyridis]
MNFKTYKICGVPQCKNTSLKTPEKLFVSVPQNRDMRVKWLQLAKRDLTGITTATRLHFCEDHFDMPNDMENYMQYHVMGSVHQVRMKRECLPTKFHCQSDQKNTTSDAEQRMNLLEEFEKEMEERTAAAKRVEFGDNLPGCSGSHQCEPKIKKQKSDNNEEIMENVSKNNFNLIQSEVPEEAVAKEEDEYDLVEQLYQLLNQSETFQEELIDASQITKDKTS